MRSTLGFRTLIFAVGRRRSSAIAIAKIEKGTEVPARLTREVLLEVIASATSTLMVSFAAYHVAAVSAAVAASAQRVVDVRLVLETGEDAGGTLRGA